MSPQALNAKGSRAHFSQQPLIPLRGRHIYCLIGCSPQCLEENALLTISGITTNFLFLPALYSFRAMANVFVGIPHKCNLPRHYLCPTLN